MGVEHWIAVSICGYTLFASLMWWTKASDCKYTEGLNKHLHEMLDSQFDASRGYREKIAVLEARISSIQKLCGNNAPTEPTKGLE